MEDLAIALQDARARLLALVLDLDDEQWMGPRLSIVNPIRWEIAHVAWFQEYWTMRRARGLAPLRADGDALYDSAKVAHDTRWDLPLPSREATLEYLSRTLERALATLDDHLDPARYFHRLTLFHEDMHAEALTYTRQTLRYAAPHCPMIVEAGPFPGDAHVDGERFRLGALPGDEFVFDNEKWAHEVEIAPFRIAKAPVTNAEMAAFVDAGGYRDRRLWSEEGWRWRTAAAAEHPLHWTRVDDRWAERHWNSIVPLVPHRPIIHVCWHEAEAWCRWARRRLPTEAEWELAASTPAKRKYPWGDSPPTAERANLDARAGWTVDVAAHPDGDSAYGCRQMIGNVWEWTASDFTPYPGFVIDPYAEYSRPWFHTHKILRGGCWATRARLLRNTWRNFYPPHRRDVLAGFRTCALDR